MKRLAILSILVFALIIKLYNIDYGLPDKERIFYYFPEIPLSSVSPENLDVYGMLGTTKSDEVDTLGAISSFRPSEFNFNPKFFYWGSLYFYVCAFILKALSLIGLITLFPEKLYYFIHVEEFAKLYIAGRITTAIFSVITIAFLYMIAKKDYGGVKVGLISAFLLSCNQHYLYYSRLMLPDILMILFAVLTLYLCLQLKEKEKIFKYYILIGVSLGLAAGAKYHGWLLFFPVLFAHLMKIKGRQSRPLLNRYFVALIFVAVSVFLLVNPYIPLDFNTVKDQLFNMPKGGLFYSYAGSVNNIFDPAYLNPLFYLRNIFFELPRYLLHEYGVFMLLLFIFALLQGIFSNSYKSRVLVILPIAIYIVLGTIRTSHLRFSEHYFLPTFPIIILLGTAFLFRLITKIGKTASGIIIGCLVLVGIMSAWNFLANEYFVSRTDPRLTAAEWVVKNIKPAASIGVSNKNYYASLPISPLRFRLKEVRLPEGLSAQELDYFVIYGRDRLSLFEPHLNREFEIVKTIEKRIGPKIPFYNGEPEKVVIFKKR